MNSPVPAAAVSDGAKWTTREALADAAARLAAVQSVPRLDAEILMAAALGISIGDMLLKHADDPAPDGFESLVLRRLTGEPMGYVLGQVGFWSIDLACGPGALIPRADSETALDAAVAHFGGRAPSSIVDLGTGPGTLLLAALAQWPQARGLGVDLSEDALCYARANAGRLGLSSRAAFRLGNWAEGISETFDLILCNPPYVEDQAALIPGVVDWEPAIALFGGADGLDHYRVLASQFGGLLGPGGIVCLEIGAGQREAVSALMAAEGFTIESRSDLNGIPRCLILSRDKV
jgi:release factor glutamine methyltransferase